MFSRIKIKTKTIWNYILLLTSIPGISFSALYYIALYISFWIASTRDQLWSHAGCRRPKICPEHNHQPPKDKGKAEVAPQPRQKNMRTVCNAATQNYLITNYITNTVEALDSWYHNNFLARYRTEFKL